MLKQIFHFLIIAISLSCSPEKEDRIQVYCAASLQPVIKELCLQWEESNKQKVVINAASSGTLARQIKNGAAADIYISANSDWMAYLQQTMQFDAEPISIAANKLALIVPEDSNAKIDSISDLAETSIGKIAVGDPGHVPLGKYTKELLNYKGIYDKLKSKLILTKDARSTLRLVELGEASAGIVYYSDAINSARVEVVSIIPSDLHSPIVYESVLLNSESEASQSLFNFLTDQNQKEVWNKYGFQ